MCVFWVYERNLTSHASNRFAIGPSAELQYSGTVSAYSERLSTVTASLGPRRKAPGILQPLLPPQFQRPLLHHVNRNVLGFRNVVSRFRVLDPTKDQFHIIYLILLFLRFWPTLLCVQVLFEIVYADSPPPATPGRMGTEDRTWEMRGLKVPLHVLIFVETFLTCWAN